MAAAPERGKANDAVLELLADDPRCSARERDAGVGRRLRDKIVELAGIVPEEIERRLAAAGGQETDTG